MKLMGSACNEVSRHLQTPNRTKQPCAQSSVPKTTAAQPHFEYGLAWTRTERVNMCVGFLLVFFVCACVRDAGEMPVTYAATIHGHRVSAT